MGTTTSLLDEENQFTLEQVGSLEKTAYAIRDNAIKHAQRKFPMRLQKAGLAGLLGYRNFVDYLKHAIAQEVAQVLATYDQHIQAVYLFEESTNPDAETEDYLSYVDLTIHLLVKVTSGSAALEAFITSLDRAITEVLRKLPSPAFASYTSFLDVLLVTEHDIQDGRGYAVLLSSIYAPPQKVWQRE
jgi:hypothetical protein